MKNRAYPWTVVERTLPNGLRVIASPDNNSPIVAVNLWYRAGSRNEPLGGNGLAHLVEHLMFEGSENVDRGQHKDLLNSIGAANVNASTSMDRTKYHQTLPATHLRLALWLEADRMGSLKVTPEGVSSQATVISHERRQVVESAPHGHWTELALASTFPAGHPYGHSAVGSPADLTVADKEKVQEFWRQHYVPNNAVLTVVGNVSAREVFVYADTYFGNIAAGAGGITQVPHEYWERAGRKVITATSRRASTDRVYTIHRTPPAYTKEHDALTVLAVVLGRGRGSLFYRELMVQKQLAIREERSVFSWDLAYGSSIFTTGTTVFPGIEAERLLFAQEAIMDTFTHASVSDVDLSRAKSLLAASWFRSVTPFGSRANALSRFAIQSPDPDLIHSHLARLEQVTRDDICRVANTYLRPENRLVLISTRDPGVDR
ncbi:M16 family metallopeptidase [Kitasatospora purpeofusca]|uniref:M16 family metallopeptidase n=1 Tax=Kitasatospora purpeofusca TaxID=67352 RepID=UPI003870823A